MNATYSASVGCGMPCGGIARTLSLRSTRSHVAACGSRSSRLAVSRLTGSFAGCGRGCCGSRRKYCFSQAWYLARVRRRRRPVARDAAGRVSSCRGGAAAGAARAATMAAVRSALRLRPSALGTAAPTHTSAAL